mgnify:CR=1 FL=1
MGRPQRQANGQIVKREDSSPGSDLRKLIKKMTPDLAMALPKGMEPDRIARIAMTQITADPKLAQCTPASFMGCLFTAAQLGLEPGGPLGHGWLIARNMWNKHLGRKVMTCTWQTGYQGYIVLAYRSGMVTGIDAEVVHEGDHFRWQKGLERVLEHRPSDDPEREDRPITHAYAVVRIRGAEPHFQVLPRSKIDRHMQMSESVKYNNGKPAGPWLDHYAEMAKKTALRAALKYAPKSAEMHQVEALENAGERGGLEVVVDPRLQGALAAQGIDMADIVDAGVPGSDPGDSGNGAPGLARAMAQAADVSVEQAEQMIEQGWELDTATGEPVPPPPPEAANE